MRTVQELLNRREERFSRHEFFVMLEQGASLDDVVPFAPGLAFWALTFQDILRLNERSVTDPYLRRIARHHRLEDAGHDRWLFGDLEKMGVGYVDVAWLFGEENGSTRAAAYALVSEVFRAPTDLCRIVLLLTLESSGRVFFQRIATYMDERTHHRTLEYFSRSHLDVEAAHQVWEDRVQEELYSRQVSADERDSALAAVNRMYDAFEAMFDGITARIHARRRTRAGRVIPKVSVNVP